MISLMERFLRLDFDAGDNCFTSLLNVDDLLFGKNADREVEICDHSFNTFFVLFVMEWLNSKQIFSFYVFCDSVCRIIRWDFLFTSFLLFPIPVLLQFFTQWLCFWFSLDFCLCILFCSTSDNSLLLFFLFCQLLVF